jgi:hypothetical protein
VHSNGWAESNPCRCVGRNILDQLDFGVLPFLYDGMFPAPTSDTVPGSKGTGLGQRPNVLKTIFPIIVSEIGAGIVRCATPHDAKSRRAFSLSSQQRMHIDRLVMLTRWSNTRVDVSIHRSSAEFRAPGQQK